MRTTKHFMIIITILCLIVCLNVVSADSIKIKEIVDNDEKHRNEELSITGAITSITYREKMGLYVVNMNNSSKGNDDKKYFETNIYFVSDETAGIYVLTTKHYEEKQELTFKTTVLMNSKDKVENDQVMLYDKYISVKTGFTSPGYSKFMLENLLKQAMKEKPWVLLIDIE